MRERARKNGSKFTNASSITTMEIIKLFPKKRSMLASNFASLIISFFEKRKLFRIFDMFSGLFKKTNGNNWIFCVEE